MCNYRISLVCSSKCEENFLRKQKKQYESIHSWFVVYIAVYSDVKLPLVLFEKCAAVSVWGKWNITRFSEEVMQDDRDLEILIEVKNVFED